MDYIPAHVIPGTIEYYLFRISKRSQAIYIIITCIVLLAIISLFFIYIDVSVSAPGFVTTKFEQQPLFAPSQGQVILSRIRTNERVLKGDTLLIIDTKVPDAHLRSLNLRKKENEQSIHDLLLLINIDSLSISKGFPTLLTSRYTSDFKRFRAKYLHHALLVNKKTANHQRISQLYSHEVISRLDYETSFFEAEQELKMLGFFFRQQVNIWQNDLTSRVAEQTVIETEINNIAEQISKRFLLSPMDGTVNISADVPVGAFLSLNQRLGELSPDGELIISAKVIPLNSGHLHKGQKVRVQVDAFNHHQWGMVEAYVMDVSDDIHFDKVGNIPYFSVRCKILNDSLIHRNGAVGLIRKGMTVNCRFIKTRESLFTLLANRADSWLNPTVN